MKKIILGLLFLNLLLLSGCSNIKTKYVELETYIDKLADNEEELEVDNDVIYQYFDEYFEQFNTINSFNIIQYPKYSESYLDDAIVFEISFDLIDDIDIYEASNQIYEKILSDFYEMNNDIEYVMTLTYYSSTDIQIEYNYEIFYSKIDIDISASSDLYDALETFNNQMTFYTNKKNIDTININITAVDYLIQLTLNQSLDYYELGLGQLDINSSYSFDFFVNYIDDILDPLGYMTIEEYTQNN